MCRDEEILENEFCVRLHQKAKAAGYLVSQMVACLLAQPENLIGRSSAEQALTIIVPKWTTGSNWRTSCHPSAQQASKRANPANPLSRQHLQKKTPQHDQTEPQGENQRTDWDAKLDRNSYKNAAAYPSDQDSSYPSDQDSSYPYSRQDSASYS
jgi:hypothetical protein